MTRITAIAVVLSGLLFLGAQTVANKAVLGTITGFRADTSEIQVKPDTGDAVLVRYSPDTIAQRVAPGDKDLKNAAKIAVTDLAIGDRVLVNFVTGSTEARRIIVMGADEIAKKKEAERLDWQKRGASGVVASIKGNEVTLRSRSFQGETLSTVIVGDKTVFRRYAPDSVRFADAKESRLPEVKVGDQLRSRGKKSEDGKRVEAEEVVFGSFLTKAGTVTVVNTESGEVTVKDIETGKPLVIKVTTDSQVKRMPDFGGMGGGMGMGQRPSGPGTGMPGGGMPGGTGMGPRPGGAPDLAQMLERMPATKIADLKPGETVVVSSTRGANTKQVTAIVLLGNADMLVQMATRQSGSGRQDPMSMGGGMGMGSGMGGGVGSLELPGMMQ